MCALMETRKKLRRCYGLNDATPFVFVVIFVSCLLVMLVSFHRHPDVSRDNKTMGFYRLLKTRKIPIKDVRLGKLGEMMVDMLPDDLAFTVFVPSEKVFARDLKLWANNTSMQDKENDNTFATLSRILGFSAVPQKLHSVDVPFRKDIAFISLSGFKLYAYSEFDGSMVVNKVYSERADLRKGEIGVQVMDGVIMYAEFQQSVQPVKLKTEPR